MNIRKLAPVALLAGILTTSSAWAVFANPQILNFPGSGVAISGEWAVVGDATVSCAAAVYRFDYTTGLWGNGAGTAGTPFQVIDEGGGCNAQPVAGFGSSVSIDDELLIIGAPLAKVSGGAIKPLGAIYFYAFDGTSWVLEEVAEEPTTQDGALFGSSVSIRKNPDSDEYLVLIGAPGYDINANADAGRAYLIEWDNIAKTSTVLNIFNGQNAGDNLGRSVTSDGVYAVVGATGYSSGIYSNNGAVFVFDGQSPYTQLAVIDHTQLSDVVNDLQIGREVSFSGGYLMVAGANSYMLQDQGIPLAPSFVQVHKVLGTNGGDVSQSDDLQAYGVLGTAVDIFDRPASDPVDYTVPGEGGVLYAEDISVSDTRLMVNGQEADVAYAYTSTCGYRPDTLEHMVWKMVSIPCNVGSATIGEVFADLGQTVDDTLVPNDNTTFIIAEQNGTNWGGAVASNVRLHAGSPVSQDKSYWIIWRGAVEGDTTTWSVPGDIGATPTVIGTGLSDADTAGHFVPTSLPTGDADVSPRPPGSPVSIMLGNPFPKQFDLSQVWVETGSGIAYLGSDAAKAWYKNGVVYVYDLGSTIPSGQNYRVVTANGTPGMGEYIEPYEGFWLLLEQAATAPFFAMPLSK